MSTIYEVAATAGVSPATVSRVFNGANVSEDKARRVREAASALNFTPSRTAQSLRRQNSEVIALVIPDIENPFFTSVARGVEDVAQAAGYSVVLCNTDDDHAKEAKYLSIAVSDNMAGVILAAIGASSDVGALIARGRPIVAVDRSPHGFAADAVTVDNFAGGRAATQALLDQGYSRLACITGPADVETAQQRSAGWRRAIADHASLTSSVSVDGDSDCYLRYSDYRVDGGRTAMRELLTLAVPPDAVFVANNLMGVGALQVLVESGLTPPAVGVALFGDLPFATLVPSGITIVRPPARELGTIAATLLLQRINGDKEPSRSIVLGNEISTV